MCLPDLCNDRIPGTWQSGNHLVKDDIHNGEMKEQMDDRLVITATTGIFSLINADTRFLLGIIVCALRGRGTPNCSCRFSKYAAHGDWLGGLDGRLPGLDQT